MELLYWHIVWFCILLLIIVWRHYIIGMFLKVISTDNYVAKYVCTQIFVSAMCRLCQLFTPSHIDILQENYQFVIYCIKKLLLLSIYFGVCEHHLRWVVDYKYLSIWLILSWWFLNVVNSILCVTLFDTNRVIYCYHHKTILYGLIFKFSIVLVDHYFQ